MSEFFIRTEELDDEHIEKFYVATKEDEKIIEKLRSSTPVVLVGSRGVGKSFLFKTAQLKMRKAFNNDAIFPVYVTFRSVPLLQSGNPQQFQLWMLNKICTTIIRELTKQGLIIQNNFHFNNSLLSNSNATVEDLIEVNRKFENSWKDPGILINTSKIPTVDEFMDSINDICEELKIKRIVVFIDEAAHIFIPEQQRQFFTLFRELRSSYFKCNATVYPGTTFYGNTFEPIHDATFIDLRRDIRDEEYVKNMKQMVLNQINDISMQNKLIEKGKEFSILAYASSGNPRLLLKSIIKAENFRKTHLDNVFKEFYRTEIWADHSQLTEKFPANTEFIDWGRNFVEDIVLKSLKDKNDRFIPLNKETTAYFWVYKNSPQEIRESLRILEYTGIIRLQQTGVKASESKIGNRYEVNLGCLLSLETNPFTTALDIINNLSLGRMSEYSSFNDVPSIEDIISDSNISEMLKIQLKKSINILDLTPWQKNKLTENNINTIEELLTCSEDDLKKIDYIKENRAKQIKHAAIASIFEWLS